MPFSSITPVSLSITLFFSFNTLLVENQFDKYAEGNLGLLLYYQYLCQILLKTVTMTKKEAIKLFEERKSGPFGTMNWKNGTFSIVDVIGVLTDSPDPRSYWKVLKNRLKKEGNETVTNCNQLKLVAEDGKKRLTDVADTEQLFRLIQSVPSPKAEPFKGWMAQIASERIDELQDPELTIDRAMWEYKRLGYSDSWINQRLKSIEIRKNLTDEWKRCGMEEGVQFAFLTDIITKTWSDKTTKEYKAYKGLRKKTSGII